MKEAFLKVFIQVVLDASIVLLYWLLVCGIDAMQNAIPGFLSNILLLVVWAGLFFSLFFLNGRLFVWMTNSYVWSISTGLLTLFIMIPVVIVSVHKPCVFLRL